MKVFAISDLHLSGAQPKPMDVFGAQWDKHWEQIQGHWRESVGEEDLVLLAGDLSWAMHLRDALPDLQELDALPGKKVILRGNHDYWWSSIGKLRSLMPPSIQALQNDALVIGPLRICGTRGWVCPDSQGFEASDEAIYQRELIRLKLSLEQAARLPGEPLIAMLHYPPFSEKRERSEFVKLLEEAEVDFVIYGHLHGKSCESAFEGMRGGIEYRLTSCDHLGFDPVLLTEC